MTAPSAPESKGLEEAAARYADIFGERSDPHYAGFIAGGRWGLSQGADESARALFNQAQTISALTAELSAAKAALEKPKHFVPEEFCEDCGYQDCKHLNPENLPVKRPEPKPVEKSGESLEERARKFASGPDGSHDKSWTFTMLYKGALWGLKQGEEERETFLAEHDENVRLHTELQVAQAKCEALEARVKELEARKFASGPVGPVARP